MQPSAAAAPFDDPGYLFEPWWPGVRAWAWVDHGELVRLRAEGLAEALITFPELAEELPERLVEDGVILDGWLLALDDGWLDTDLLRRRLGGDPRAGRPAFVASDLLWSGGESLERRSFGHPSTALESVLLDGDHASSRTQSRATGRLRRGPRSLRHRGHQAHRLDARHRHGAAGDAWLPLLSGRRRCPSARDWRSSSGRPLPGRSARQERLETHAARPADPRRRGGPRRAGSSE